MADSDEQTQAALMQRIAQMQPPFASLLGLRLTHVSLDKLEAELPIREELSNRNGVLHGGAIMAFADNLGGTATFINLPDGARTTTIESKTNFFAAIKIGDVAHTLTTPLHRGRTTMVWQTRMSRGDGKLAALTTQTQMVIWPEKKG